MYYDDTMQVDVDITGLLEGSKWFRYEDGHHPHAVVPPLPRYANLPTTNHTMHKQGIYLELAAFDDYQHIVYREHALILLVTACRV